MEWAGRFNRPGEAPGSQTQMADRSQFGERKQNLRSHLRDLHPGVGESGIFATIAQFVATSLPMKTSLILSTSLLLVSMPAVANPIAVVQELSGREVAGPHVKLTCTYNTGAPTIATHGLSHTPWVGVGSTYRDTGSGAQEIHIVAMCDCHVPTGTTLDYGTGDSSPLGAVHVEVTGEAKGDDCLVPCELVDAAVADTGSPDGLGATPGATGGVPTPGTPPAAKGSGCAFIPRGRTAVPLGLALFGLGLVFWRRRS